MTVSAQTNIVVYTGDGVAVEFDFTFPVYDADHLYVYLQDIATGEIDYTYTPSEYSVDGVLDPAGGSVTLDGAAPDTDHKVIIERLVDYNQLLDVDNEGGFYPDNVELQLDLIEMQIQQLRERVNRSVKGFLGETFVDLPGPGGRANTFIGFNSSGVLELFEDTGDASSFDLSNVLRVPESIAEIAAAATRANKYLKFDAGGEVELAVGSVTLADGDYGSVTVSGSGTVITIDNLAVVTAMLANDAATYAKIQNVSATDRILGRFSASAGDIEEGVFTDLAQTLAAQTTAANHLTQLGFSSFFQTLIDETTGAAILALLGGANGTIIEGSLADPGYVVFEATALLGADLMIQWGSNSIGDDTSETLTFPEPFATFAVITVTGGPTNTSQEGDVHATSCSNTAANIVNTNQNTNSYFWIAVGDH